VFTTTQIRSTTKHFNMAKRTQPSSGLQLNFAFDIGKAVTGTFDAGEISSDGGLGLIRAADNRLHLTDDLAFCFLDKRRPDYVTHSPVQLLRQRIYAICAGYEDANDASILRLDPMHKLAVGRAPTDRALASQPTISRFENAAGALELKFAQDFLVHLYIRSHRKPPRKVVLDLDTTCDPVHGYQQLSFYNKFYGTFCYIPMFIFDQNGFPLAALLRAGNADVGGDAARCLRSVLEILKAAWPQVTVEFRADAAFCRREVYEVCEQFNTTYFIGLKKNHALVCLAKELVSEATDEFKAIFGEPEKLDKTAWRRKQEQMRFASKSAGRMQELHETFRMTRKVGQLSWRGRGYKDDMRVICRADVTDDGPELRFVITNHPNGNPRWLYESNYCRRGQCENWIKELKLIDCDRLSCQEFEANQFRLLMHVFAYILLRDGRERLARRGPRISIDQYRLKFVKVAVLVQETAKAVALHWSSNYPYKAEFMRLSAVF
jgi:hypothetical protein